MDKSIVWPTCEAGTLENLLFVKMGHIECLNEKGVRHGPIERQVHVVNEEEQLVPSNFNIPDAFRGLRNG
jgi:hypothetical protein